MRTLPALLLTATLVASLTSCAGGPFGSGCDSPVSAGDASAVVTATGKFDTKPTVEFPTPVVTKKTERSELLPGNGAPLEEGQAAVLKFTILNGTDGTVLQQSDYTGAGSLITIGKSEVPVVSLGLQCATVGSRVAIVGSAKDTHDGQADPNSGIGADDAFVYVIDIVKAFPAKASGAAQIPQPGLPAVVTAPDGAPGITVPKTDPPKKLTVAVLQRGDGKKVAADDQVVVKYTGVLWADSSVFDSTWTKHQASVVQLKESSTVTAGFADGLAGQRIGSQVLLVVPPGEGFGDAGSTGVPPGSTLIYVVDILGLAR